MNAMRSGSAGRIRTVQGNRAATTGIRLTLAHRRELTSASMCFLYLGYWASQPTL